MKNSDCHNMSEENQYRGPRRSVSPLSRVLQMQAHNHEGCDGTVAVGAFAGFLSASLDQEP
jgi:hypothetical protein